MIIIRMTGGMGNQMFQYALYLKLRKMGRQVKFDDRTEYELSNARPIVLWAFGLQDYEKASPREINLITDGCMNPFSRIRRKLFGRKSLEYGEADSNFDPHVLEKENAYLTGYFQSEKYFEDIKAEVRKAFTFQPVIFQGLTEEAKGNFQKYRDEIGESASVCIHIRRGDYLENNQAYGGICTEVYYEKAVSLMKEHFPEAVFFVFSNDEPWAEEWSRHMEKAKRSRFVTVRGFPEDLGYLAMLLMSECKGHIIANSSFSWWSSWLSQHPKKLVIAPEVWMNGKDCRDIYREDMVLVDAKGRSFREQKLP